MSGDSAQGTNNIDLAAKGRKYSILELICRNSDEGRSTKFDEVRKLFPDISAPLLNGYLKTFIEMGLVGKENHGCYEWAACWQKRIFAKSAYGSRQEVRTEIKEKVAHACLTHVKPDGQPLLGSRFCLISHGSSTEPLFRGIRFVDAQFRPASVVTNSIPGFLALLNAPVVLSIIAGTAEVSCGAIKPNFSAGSGGANSPGASFGAVCFNLVVLSCSSINPDGDIHCGDEMEEMRSEILKRDVDVIVLADRSKVTNPAGVRVSTKIRSSPGRRWLFVDAPKRGEKLPAEQDKIFKKFREKWGEDYFVPVPVDV